MVTAPSLIPAARICSLRSFHARIQTMPPIRQDVVPNVNVFESDNRSSYNALMVHLQGNMRRFNLVANYSSQRRNLGLPARRTF